jgi:hypothetical protein
VKSWIRIRISIKAKILELSRLKTEPWRAVDAQNRGVGAQYGGLDVWRPVLLDSQNLEEEQDPDMH